ncbi:MAG TPA: hypothetical protein GX715_06785 [Armatimonadetes bacterium]|jgi:plasmid stabilization system protein ParE|nr:hypothetical protein [Armatimonadota bacterium]
MAAPDFYFAINATFRFIEERWGEEALNRYWDAMGRGYYAPLSARFRSGGLAAVEGYWRAFFAEEPGGAVEVRREGDRVAIRVRRCPALQHLRGHGREVLPRYCQHCRVVSRVIAENAGLSFAMEGGDGACEQWWMDEGEGRP